MRYLVDHPVEPYFQHIAVAPWPIITRDSTIDWIDTILTLEDWLVNSVGAHYDRWVYATARDQTLWHACVAFRSGSDRTLFLLRWA